MLGYRHEAEVTSLPEKYAATQQADGGFICKRLLANKPVRKSCYKASLAALLLYAECKLRNTILPGTEGLLELFLKRDVFYDSAGKMKLRLDGNLGWCGIDNFFAVETMCIGLPLTIAVQGGGINLGFPEPGQSLRRKDRQMAGISWKGR